MSSTLAARMTRQERLYIVAVALGAGYGLSVRGLAFVRTVPWLGSVIVVMSLAFVFVMPFAMGYLTIAVLARQGPTSIAARIFQPWIATLLALGGCGAVAWEGLICLVMMAPVALLLASVGGLVAGAIVSAERPQIANFSIAIVALLPFLVTPMEQRIAAPAQVRSVESDIVIRAPRETVWRNVERVPAIAAAELPRSWNRSIGFPRPVEATLSHEGLGGVRHATFAGNVLFIETIDVWDDQQRLGFSIKADTQHIPPTTLDQHVTIGGPYFDVLHGEYILEPSANGEIKLRLISRHRVSTDFNWYARLWTDAVMRDVQKSILFVIKNRCEAAAR